MAVKSWTLCDVDNDHYIEAISILPNDVGGLASGYSITKRRLHGGLRDGVDVIEVDNGNFRFVAVPTRGMGVWRARLGDVQLGWRSPVRGPVNPAFVPLSEAGGLGWLDGFDELLVRCGLESNGAPEFNDDGTLRYPLHGKIANIPAHKVLASVDGREGRIELTGVVDEARLFFNKLRLTSTYVTTVGQPGMTLIDTVTNISAEPAELELLYHINFGTPLLDAGSKVVLPVRRLAPRDAVAAGTVDQWDTYGPETPGVSESVFFMQLAGDQEGNTRALLRNAAGNQGVSLLFNTQQLPYFTLWKNPQAAIDGYVTGLEPGINFPNCKSFEKQQGRVVVLQPQQSLRFEITLEVHPDEQSVQEATQQVMALQGDREPEILAQPDPQWSKT